MLSMLSITDGHNRPALSVLMRVMHCYLLGGRNVQNLKPSRAFIMLQLKRAALLKTAVAFERTRTRNLANQLSIKVCQGERGRGLLNYLLPTSAHTHKPVNRVENGWLVVGWFFSTHMPIYHSDRLPGFATNVVLMGVGCNSFRNKLQHTHYYHQGEAWSVCVRRVPFENEP